MEKQKNRSNFIVGIILAVVLAAAGYIAWDKLVKGPDEADTIADVKVETEVIGNVATGWDTDMQEIAEFAEKSDATCFYVDKSGQMSQMNKDEFIEKADAVSTKPYSYMSQIMTTKLEHFLGLSRGDHEFLMLDNVNGDSWCEIGAVGDDTRKVIEAWYGGSIDNYFEDHNLRLECQDVKIDKAVFLEEGNGIELTDVWIFIAHGDTKTVTATDYDGSDGKYPKEGQTKTLKITYEAAIDDSDGSWNLMNMDVDW